MTRFDDLIVAPTSEKCFLVVLRPYDPVSGTIVTIRLSSHGFTSKPTDDPANTHYPARISGMLNFTRSLFAQGRLSGRSVPGQGDIGLVNADGGLDHLAGYAWGGRQVQVWMGGPDFQLYEFGLIFDGTAQGLEWNDDEIRVKTRDLQYVFDKEFQSDVFAGTGGAEGGDDLKDKRKPRVFGYASAVPPVYLGINGGLHRFTVGGPIVGVDRVLDKAIPLTQVGNALNPGEWSVDLATGIITLGGSYDGPLVADVAGWCYRSEASTSSHMIGTGSRAFAVASLTGFAIGQRVRALADASPSLNWVEGVVTGASSGTLTILVDKVAGAGTFAAWTLCPLGTVAGLVQALALAAGVPIVAGAIAALDAAQPATVGTWRAEGGRYADVLDELVDGIGGYWGFNRTGFFDVGRMTGPGTAVLSLDSNAILSMSRPATQEPHHEFVVRYARAWTLHSGDQVAGAASDSDRKFLTAEWRQSKVNSAPTLTAWPLSESVTVDSPIVQQTDAAAEASRLLSIYSVQRNYFRMTFKTQPLALDIGQTILVTDKRSNPRYSLGVGRLFLIVDMTEDLDDNTVELGLWG